VKSVFGRITSPLGGLSALEVLGAANAVFLSRRTVIPKKSYRREIGGWRVEEQSDAFRGPFLHG
jgi:hypothetical protein